MSSIKDLGRGPKRDNDEAGLGQYSLVGKSIVCPHCSGTQFKVGEAQLNTAVATLLNLDWTNKSATILICAGCGQVQWFEKQPSRVA
jgi:predicted nucleic-acid-binding Zn-ribbon protein